MKKKMYCFNCDKDVEIVVKNEKREYCIHNISFDVIEKVYYCKECGNELTNDNLDNDLSSIYKEYLKLYGLSFDKLLEIRKSLGLSQELFSKALGWSKKTIVRYENRQVLPQPEYLNIYKRIMCNKFEFIKILEERKNLIDKNIFDAILLRLNDDLDIKGINVLLYMLDNNPLSITQIMKNMFAVDFENYKVNSSPLTNLKYVHGYFGPMIDNRAKYINDLSAQGYLIFYADDKENIIFKSNKKYDLNLFNEQEIEVMDKVKKKLIGKTATELTNWSHNFLGWKKTNNGEIISYNYAKNFDLDSI